MLPNIGFLLWDVTRKLKPGKPIMHQTTCPVCGRKLINIYLRNGEWKCKQCWEVSHE